MYVRGKTLESEIERLAQQTEAPQAFVRQVRELFRTRGIPMDSDSGPYLAVLERVFLREQQIRLYATQTRQRLEKLQKHLVRLNENVERQLGTMRKTRASTPGRKPAPSGKRAVRMVQPREWRSKRSLPASGRTLLVPGPKEIQ